MRWDSLYYVLLDNSNLIEGYISKIIDSIQKPYLPLKGHNKLAIVPKVTLPDKHLPVRIFSLTTLIGLMLCSVGT